MLKYLRNFAISAALVFTGTAHALPIVEADAFTPGDNKAALETSTGLVWMDFGVNSHLSYGHVGSLLTTDFAGWRFPTVAEVDHLWTSLFGTLPEWNRFDPSIGSLASFSHTDYFNSIFNVFGQESDTTYFTLDSDGNILESWTVKHLFGVFMEESGASGYVSMSVPYDPKYANSAFYLEFDTDVSGWTGPLLVKDTTASVPEPGSILLMLVAFGALLIRRGHLN